jgi:hypothetical protein
VVSFGAQGEHETEAGAFSGPVVTRLFPGPFLAPNAKRSCFAELWHTLEALRDHEFAPAFLAPVLGWTLLSGGRVSVIVTLLGAIFVNMITSGLLLMRVGEFWVQACLGLMLLAAVVIDRGRHAVLRRRGLA